MANKKGLFAAFGLTCLLTIGVAVGISGQQNKVERFARADAETYALNNLNFDGYIGGTAAGNRFNGSDGYHFMVNSCDGTTDYDVKLWNYDSGWTLSTSTQYELDVEFKIDSVASGTLKMMSQCRFQKAEHDGDPDIPDIPDLFSEQEFTETGKYLHFTKTFTPSVATPEIELHFGKTSGAFHILINRFVVREKLSGNVVVSAFLESPGEFASRWNTANLAKGLCSASDETVKAFLKDYADLVPWARGNEEGQLGAIAANDVTGYEGSSVKSSVLYFASRLNVTFA